MKYTIQYNNGKESIKNLTLEEAIDYKIEHMQDVKEFVVIEQTRKPSKPKSTSIKDVRVAFMATLSPNQHERLKTGQLVVKYSTHPDIMGFYLQVVHKDTTFFSVEKLKKERKENVISCFKDTVKNYSIELFKGTEGKMKQRHGIEDFTDKEWWEIINEFLKMN